jgi:PDZ domain-containing secreted protein
LSPGEEEHLTLEDDPDMDLDKLLQGIDDEQPSPDFLHTPQLSMEEEHWMENELLDKEDVEAVEETKAKDDDDMEKEVKSEEEEEEVEVEKEEVAEVLEEVKGKLGKRKASKGRGARLKCAWWTTEEKVLIDLVDKTNNFEIEEVQQTWPEVHKYAVGESEEV